VERWVQENGQPQTHEGDPVPWVDGIISDISQRKHNEMRIEALLAEQSAILDNVMFGVMFVRHRTIVSVNRRCEELFGYEPGAWRALPRPCCSRRFDFESRRAPVPSLSQGDYFSEERQYRRKDGSVFWCLVSGYALDKQPRQRRQHLGVCRHHRAQGSGRKAAPVRHRDRAHCRRRGGAGCQGTIVAVNPAFTLITGYTEAEALGKDRTLTRSGRHEPAFYEACGRSR
jgi:PAS domain-containing protein